MTAPQHHAGDTVRRRSPNTPTIAADTVDAPSASATTPRGASDNPRQPLLSRDSTPSKPDSNSPHVAATGRDDAIDAEMDLSQFSRKTQWIVLAVASGACAAFNGVFAKLTTTELTTGIATNIAKLFGLDSIETVVEYIIRAIFFGLNLVFNGIMWALFTKALARGTSTTQVSILNTSANFMITAIVGFIVFGENLPPLWWLGAALLVAGNVIIGRREETDPAATAAADDGRGTRSEEAELMSDEVELGSGDASRLSSDRGRRQEDEDEDILDLGDDLLNGFTGRRS